MEKLRACGVARGVESSEAPDVPDAPVVARWRGGGRRPFLVLNALDGAFAGEDGLGGLLAGGLRAL